ncbi:hypothetical protein AVDCRST_MAG81-2545 [uncultured Synechococcales cyanobacterium]|uniref:Uncharacterized protein n=1 Tax=uncultured Synechococcales cyanobacterium TaxID=1936017 RepID=A0A6J4VFY0_9CYAN|nr:hypothetical protein AVDCRST_MAG81-2545 [uncultured Synechococcales cyanobacterium]
MVEQNCNLGNVHRLSPKVIKIATEQFDQTLVVRDIGFRAMSEEGKTQSINGKMSFDAIGAFVMTEAFRLNACITSVFNSL